MQIQKQLTQITKDLEMVSKKVRQLTESLTGVEGKKSIKSRSASRTETSPGQTPFWI